MSKKHKRSFFYGYIVVAAAFSVMMITWGANRTFGVFLEPMLEEFGWPRAATSGAFTLGFIVTASLGILAGRLSDRFGPRAVLSVCGLFVGAAYLLMSKVSTIWHLYLFFGVIGGIGMSGAQAPIMSTIARWFTKRRGMMTGIIGAGPSLGITFFPLTASWLIVNQGWRFSSAVLGLLSLTLVIIAAQFLKRDPQQLGLLPYGGERSKVELKEALAEREFCVKDAVCTRQFWMLCIIFFLDMFMVNIVLVHIVLFAVGRGIPAVTAASILSTAAAVSIAGKITISSMADRIGSRRATIISLALASSGFVILLVSSKLWMFFLFGLVFGIGGWAAGPLMSIMVAELFGTRAHGAIYAVSVCISQIGGAIGPVIAGYVFDVTGSYQLAFAGSIILGIIAITLTFLIKSPTKQGAKSTRVALNRG